MSLLLTAEAKKPYIYYQQEETHIKRCKDLGTKA
jgi:hypothetical protein